MTTTPNQDQGAQAPDLSNDPLDVLHSLMLAVSYYRLKANVHRDLPESRDLDAAMVAAAEARKVGKAEAEKAALRLDPLRTLVNLLRSDVALYTACPDPVRSLLSELFLPTHTSYSAALESHRETREAWERAGEKTRAYIATLKADLAKAQADLAEMRALYEASSKPRRVASRKVKEAAE